MTTTTTQQLQAAQAHHASSRIQNMQTAGSQTITSLAVLHLDTFPVSAHLLHANGFAVNP